MSYIKRIISNIREDCLTVFFTATATLSVMGSVYVGISDSRLNYEFSQSQAKDIADKDENGILDENEMLDLARSLGMVEEDESVTLHELESRITSAPKEVLDIYREDYVDRLLAHAGELATEAKALLESTSKESKFKMTDSVFTDYGRH